MNPKKFAPAVEQFLNGVFDVLGGMVSRTVEHTAQPPGPAEALETHLADFAVALHGKLRDDAGGAAILLKTADAGKIAAMVLEGDLTEKEALDDDDRGTLAELTSVVIPAGLTAFLLHAELPGTEVDATEVHDGGVDARDAVALSVGEKATLVPFTYKLGDDLEGDGRLLFSENLSAPATDKRTVVGPELTPEEMSDILSGFDGDLTDTSALTNDAHPANLTPSNLGMVLDIRLVATARLGRAEVPIADILNYGPGSIIEVGQSVDEPVELLVNNKLIARGDVVVVDEKFGLRITEIVSQKERIESLR